MNCARRAVLSPEPSPSKATGSYNVLTAGWRRPRSVGSVIFPRDALFQQGEKGVRYLFFAHTIGRWRAEPVEAFGDRARRGMAAASLRGLTLRPLTFKEGVALPHFRRHGSRAMLPGAT
jgi:hypothetical protein